MSSAAAARSASSIAYFLSRRGAQPIVIERHAVAGAASGKSGGFLALDWCRGSALDALARRSFDLHAELADELGNPWSYRRLATYGGYAAENGRVRNSAPRPWLSGRVEITGRLGSPQTTALVEPRAFTTGLMRAAEAQGATLRLGTVAGLMRRPDGAVRGVVLDSGESVEGDAVIIAMGPWSMLATRWLPLPAVFGYKGHSLVFETGDGHSRRGAVPRIPGGERRDPQPELFPRADGTTWVCAISRAGALPIDPADVVGDAGAHAAARDDVPEHLAGACRDADHGAPGVLPAGHRGRLAADRRRCRESTAPTWRPATASGACSTRRRPARRWPS